MTEGGFGSGATMVNEAAAPIEEGRRLATMPGPKNQVAAWGARRDVFATHVRQHLAVLGPSVLLDKLSSAHRWPKQAANSPTETLFCEYAATDGWGAVLQVLADIIGETRDARAASRA